MLEVKLVSEDNVIEMTKWQVVGKTSTSVLLQCSNNISRTECIIRVAGQLITSTGKKLNEIVNMTGHTLLASY